MSKATIVLDRNGVRNLMLSSEMMELCAELGSGIMEKLGDGYLMTQYPTGKTRVNVSIMTDSKEARKENAENNTILKALGGGV